MLVHAEYLLHDEDGGEFAAVRRQRAIARNLAICDRDFNRAGHEPGRLRVYGLREPRPARSRRPVIF